MENIILNIDDEPSNRIITKIFLEKFFDPEKYIIIDASGGKEALDMFYGLVSGKYHITLVISDFNMPDFSGISVAGIMRQNGYKGIFNILTATDKQYVDVDTTEVNRVYEKPITKPMVQEWLEQTERNENEKNTGS